jgi:DNA primase
MSDAGPAPRSETLAKIPSEKIAEIRDRVDVERVVGRSVRLTRRGNRLVGLCPFHKEKTPSFGVSREKQLFHCFGCQAGGDIFAFIMRLEGIGFAEAARLLAREAGVELPEEEETPEARAARTLRERLLEVNEHAARHFERRLAAAPEARAYLLETRGLTEATIRRFRLGWAPPEWQDLSAHLEQRRVDLDAAVQVGLLGRSARDGRLYDRLRGRVVFPIELPGGAVAGFGARRADWVDPEGPKYLNSPESPVYDKSSIFYGLAAARDAIRRARRAVLVEGYVDVIALFQHGLELAIAACGTALSSKHAGVLARLCDEVVTCYDGDEAGREATWKATLALVAEGIEVRVASLPQGEDPDTLAARIGAEGLRKLVDDAPSAVDFFVAEARARHAGGGIAGATRAVEAIKPLILAIRDPLKRDVTIGAAARRLGIDPQVLSRHLSVRRGPGGSGPGDGPRPGPGPRDPRPETRQPPIPVVEQALLRLLIARPAPVLEALERRGARRAFSSPAVEAAFDAAGARIAEEGPGARFDGARALEAMREAGLDERDLAQHRQTLMASESLPVEDDLEECISRLMKRHWDSRVRALRRRIEQEVDPEAQIRLAAEVLEAQAEASKLMAFAERP